MKYTLNFCKNKIGLLAFCLFILQQSLSWAAPVNLSLQDSIDLALMNNFSIFIAATDKEKSVLSYHEVKADKMPNVTIGSSYTTKDFSKDGEVNNNLKINWQLYSGGKVGGLVKQAEFGMTAAELALQKTKQQIKLETVSNYYNILQARSMLNVNQENVNSLQEHLKMVQAMYETGVVARADILRAEVELVNAQQNQIKSQNDYDVAVIALLNTMNIDQETEIILAGDLSYEKYDKDLKESIKLAKANHPDIIQTIIDIRSAEVGVKVAESAKYPVVALTASTELNDYLLPESDKWSLGLSASLSVFDADLASNKVKQAKIAVNRAKMQAEQVIDTVEQEVRQSYLSMQEAEKRLSSTGVAITKATEDLEISHEKYNAGVGTNLDVMDAQLVLTQAKTNHVQALYDYNLNKARVLKAMGEIVE